MRQIILPVVISEKLVFDYELKELESPCGLSKDNSVPHSPNDLADSWIDSDSSESMQFVDYFPT